MPQSQQFKVDQIIGAIGAVGTVLLVIQRWQLYTPLQRAMYAVYICIFLVPVWAPWLNPRMFQRHRTTVIVLGKMLCLALPAARFQVRLNQPASGRLLQDLFSVCHGKPH